MKQQTHDPCDGEAKALFAKKKLQTDPHRVYSKCVNRIENKMHTAK